MTYQSQSARIELLRAQEAALVFRRFERSDAWTLGTTMTQHAIDNHLPAAIDIRKPGLILFRAALAGTTPDIEHWIARKAAVAARFEQSSAGVVERMARNGVDPGTNGWLDPTAYAVCGGAVPVRVAGAGVVAVVTVSGLSSEDEEHELAIRYMTELIESQGAASRV